MEGRDERGRGREGGEGGTEHGREKGRREIKNVPNMNVGRAYPNKLYYDIANSTNNKGH